MHIIQQSGDFKEMNKKCVDCSTTRTPLWRGGPAGPRSLCNACGIRYRKKNRALLGLKRDSRTEKSKSNGRMDVPGNRELKSKKLREEEEAAFLLMALSCGNVYHGSMLSSC